MLMVANYIMFEESFKNPKLSGPFNTCIQLLFIGQVIITVSTNWFCFIKSIVGIYLKTHSSKNHNFVFCSYSIFLIVEDL